jgi:DNA repair protein RadA/Sms
MARPRTGFFCSECGQESAAWQGRCPGCNAWNTLREAPRPMPAARRRVAGSDPAAVPVPVRLGAVHADRGDRWRTGLDEFDHVLGGGVVPGSVVLVGGEPGIGKSTILLQVASRLEAGGHAALYSSGEESAGQVRIRADRLGGGSGDVTFLAEADLDRILVAAGQIGPSCLFIDSIQTVFVGDVEGAPGSVTQVRECAARLQQFAKASGVAVFVVGHVTKSGLVAGPKTLEHIVDTVLYFEAGGSLDHRVLRATKNRFGAVDEIGVFRMGASGLLAVTNPSEIFLSDRHADVSGVAVVAVIEGTRPLLVEVQALCTRATYGAPQRVASGLDRQRLALLLAILERRVGLRFGETDVFVNVVGGMRLGETAGDLAVAVALASSMHDRPLPRDAVFLGELGLGGELRPVGQGERRLAEAGRMGFRKAYMAGGAAPPRASGIVLVTRTSLPQIVRELFP